MKISSPTLIIKKKVCEKNIDSMLNKSKINGLIFRPHFKTHQLAEVGEWFKFAGIDKITVSSVEMATFFANYGWKDITIAFPVNLREIKKLNYLASQIHLNVITDSVFVVEELSKWIESLLYIFIEIDTGYRRTGIYYDNTSEIGNIIRAIQNKQKLKFEGFLTHSGNTYQAETLKEIDSIHRKAINKLVKLKNTFRNYNNDLVLSIGDTPGCSVSNYFKGINEIRPGNFVFYDWMQYKLGSCSIDEIAVVVVCPVVAKYSDRLEIVIHGGAVHFSKEYIYTKEKTKNYGQVIDIKHNNLPIVNCYISSLSQEHGIVNCTKEYFEKTRIGELVGIIPVHSCLTMNLMKTHYQIET